MGMYVNPLRDTQKNWLSNNGTIIIGDVVSSYSAIRNSNCVPVCLVDNGGFTASAVGYDLAETAEFARKDGRPKTWFSVPIDKFDYTSGLSAYDIQRLAKLKF